MRVLVPNLGSTSLKYQLLETESETVLARGKIDRIGGAESQIVCWQTGSAEEWRSAALVPDHRAAIKILVDRLGGLGTGAGIAAVGFKAVHGGPRYCGSFLVDDGLLAAMQDYVPVAPAHNPIYIQAMRIFREILPGVPLVAVFETGFHSTVPEHANIYGVPQEWREKYGVRRYGFHGSSHRYISQRVPELLSRPIKELRLISCHLGGSSSITAIHSGESVDTSMGFSPQSGLEQSSRCGDLDPFAVLHVMEKENLTPAEARQVLCKKSGLLGISGISNDVRDLENGAKEGNARAALALEVFTYEVKRYVGAYAAAMGGLDALAFAGGIGENSPRVRQQVCNGLEFLGIHLNQEANRVPADGDRVISLPCSRVAVLVIYTNEELMVARETAKVLASS
ncbi:MAG: acetate kinase [Terriglobia bacterium]